jgi:hypothetical protein
MDTHTLLAGFIRIVGIQYLLSALLVFTNIPERLLIAAHTTSAMTSAASTGAIALVFRFLVYLIISVCLWAFASPLAKLVSGGVAREV